MTPVAVSPSGAVTDCTCVPRGTPNTHSQDVYEVVTQAGVYYMTGAS